MASLSRKEARIEAFHLLFETEFQANADPCQVYSRSVENRELEENEYVREVYFGVRAHLSEIDDIILRHAKGWRTERITPVSRSIMRLSIYEMLYMESIPVTVSLNEAVELVKKFDDKKMRAFVNGVLNAAKDEIEQKRTHG